MITCKYEEDPIKNKGANVLARLYDIFFRRSRAIYSEVSSGILPKFELIQGFIVVLVTCKNQEDPTKNEGARVLTKFSPIISLWEFFQIAQILGRIWLKFYLVRDIIDVPVTYKYEEDPIKNEDARVLTRLYDVFQTLKGNLLKSQRRNSAQIGTHPRFYSCPRYLQE